MKISTKLLIPALLAVATTSCLTPEEIESAPTGTTSTTSLGETTGQGGSLARFTVVGNTMYFVDNSNLQVMDIKDANNPVLVYSVELPNEDIETIYSHETYLYIGSSTGMYIYDINVRSEPKFLSRTAHISGCDPVVSDGEYAYVTIRNSVQCNTLVDYNAMEIYDVSNPESPILVHTEFMNAPAGLAIDGNTLFVCDDELKVYDVTTKNNPSLVNSYAINAVDVIVDGDNVLAITTSGIIQYSYDKINQKLTFKSSTVSK